MFIFDDVTDTSRLTIEHGINIDSKNGLNKIFDEYDDSQRDEVMDTINKMSIELFKRDEIIKW